jgi:hypothetical protein
MTKKSFYVEGCGLFKDTMCLYSSLNIIRQIKSRRIRRAGHVARMGEERKQYKVLLGKPEGKRPVGKPRRRWEDGIRLDLTEIGWIQSVQGRDRWWALANTVMNVPTWCQGVMSLEKDQNKEDVPNESKALY